MPAMYDLILTGGRVHADDATGIAEIAIAGETIAAIAPRIDAPARRRLDATGLEVLPGLIDPHVHLGLSMPGAVSCDDIRSGTRAALHGGVTTVLDFSVQRPGESLATAVAERRREFAGASHCDYAIHANLTDFGTDLAGDFEARFAAELGALAAEGGASLKIFTTYSRRGMMIPKSLLEGVLRVASARGVLVLVHAEDDALVQAATDALQPEELCDPRAFPRSRPREAEREAVTEVAEAAVRAGARVYFVHLTTAGALAAIEHARRAPPASGRTAPPIHAETCPHYLLLTEAEYAGRHGRQRIVTPPLRSEEDRAALVRGLERGVIDVIATDHCPFRSSDTMRPEAPVTELPSGLPGIETRLPLVWTLGARDGLLTERRRVELLATNAAKIFGLYPRKGAIRPGADADLVLFDPAPRWAIEARSLHMSADHSPFEGMKVQGSVRAVLLRGRMTLENGEVTADPRGEYLARGAGGNPT